MPQSQQTPQIYKAVETMLKACLPATCRLYHVSAPLQVMDSIKRQDNQLCLWAISTDKQRINSSGLTPVHELTLEVNLVGSLETIDDITGALITLTTGEEIEAEGWTFDIDQKSRKDYWEPQIQAKRIWLQFAGLAIEPGPGTAG